MTQATVEHSMGNRVPAQQLQLFPGLSRTDIPSRQTVQVIRINGADYKQVRACVVPGWAPQKNTSIEIAQAKIFAFDGTWPEITMFLDLPTSGWQSIEALSQCVPSCQK